MARFCGVFSPRNPALASRQHVEAMLAAFIRHTPQIESWYVDEDAGLVVAALSHEAGAGPDWLAEGGRLATFSGFVTEAGPYSSEHSGREGARRILDVIESASLELLAGEFALAAWDGARGQLTLAVDPQSTWALYYQRDEATGMTVFATEPKAIQAHPQGRREINPAGLAYYLFNTHVSPPLTAFRGMQRLHCGEKLTLTTDGATSSVLDWTYPEPSPEIRDLGFWSNELSNRHNTYLENVIAGQEKVGLLLGAGIDSSLLYGRFKTAFPDVQVVPICAYYPPTTLHKYANLDLPFARKLAQHWGDQLVEVGLSFDSVFDVLEPVLRQTDQPFMNIGNNTAVLTMAHRASELDVAVLIGGQGGSENFSVKGWETIRKAQAEGRLTTLDDMIEFTDSHPLQFSFDRIQRLMLEPPADIKNDVHSTYMPILAKVPSPSLFEKRLYGMRHIITREHILHNSTSVMTMWSGRYANAFFDWNTVRFGATIPSVFKGSEDDGLARAVLYHRDRNLVPEWVFQREKRGMPGFPFNNGLFPQLEGRLLSRPVVESQGVFDPDTFEKACAKRGLRKSLLMAQIWLDIHVFQQDETFNLIEADYRAYRKNRPD